MTTPREETMSAEQDNKANASADPFAGLPPADTKRWVVSRKAQVVRAVEDGVITLEQACERYSLSHEEFSNWRELIKAHGTRALRATRIQDYRRASRRFRSGS
ncbi:DUF1153 domain-containing protein [Nisaea acidiphila]|uniref:DUF1153 domain-containing protein n=1 Tax=Nisaea acidiphila TaxID=1862145 RepID=A0A9J7AYJ9_9PROT|nr:DUF1153 domain-containing protein [Nisaea acidiphila]UUX50509.1 DUF1153 domain-containing protein [Nisaea acidiphila]